MTADMFAGKSDQLLRHLRAEALRRARTARGPSAAQAADRAAVRYQVELDRRAAEATS